jgi:hypothetical protein
MTSFASTTPSGGGNLEAIHAGTVAPSDVVIEFSHPHRDRQSRRRYSSPFMRVMTMRAHSAVVAVVVSTRMS